MSELARSTYPIALTLARPLSSGRFWAIPIIGAVVKFIFIARPEKSNRFFAIPLIGILVKWLILIPHFVILNALVFDLALCQLVIWILVLFVGRYPDWAFGLVGGTLSWSCRVYSYLLGLTDSYPPFSFT